MYTDNMRHRRISPASFFMYTRVFRVCPHERSFQLFPPELCLRWRTNETAVSCFVFVSDTRNACVCRTRTADTRNTHMADYIGLFVVHIIKETYKRDL